MKALFIDTVKSEARLIDLDLSGEDGYMQISKAIGCEYFTAVTVKASKEGEPPHMETLYCDDMGAINGTKHGLIHFKYGPIFGNCLILGTDEGGESVDTRLTPAELDGLGIEYSFDTKDDGFTTNKIKVE